LQENQSLNNLRWTNGGGVLVWKIEVCIATGHSLSSTKISEIWIKGLYCYNIFKNQKLNKCVIERENGVSMLGESPYICGMYVICTQR